VPAVALVVVVEGDTTTEVGGMTAVDDVPTTVGAPVAVMPVAAVAGVDGVEPVVAVTPGVGGAATALIIAALTPAAKKRAR
jgi:hypothetical protein